MRVRERPSIHSAEIGKLWYGDTVSVEAYANGWALVGGVSNETGGGWVQVGYIADALTDPLECKTTALVRMRDLPDGEPMTENGWIVNEFLEEETK